MEDRNYEQEAREQGWNPDFKGANKMDAQAFIEKSERVAPIAMSKLKDERAKNEQLVKRVEVLESSNQTMLVANKDFGAYKDGQLTKERQRSSELLAELETRRATAITDADGAEFTRIDREIEQVRNDMAPPTNGRPATDPLYDAWVINNGWYNTDPKLRAIADGIEGGIAQRGYTGQAYYDEVTRQVKKMNPESFGNKRRSGTTDVEPGGELERKDSEAQTYDNLPSDAKAACDRFVASGHTTKESYCKTYDWG